MSRTYSRVPCLVASSAVAAAGEGPAAPLLEVLHANTFTLGSTELASAAPVTVACLAVGWRVLSPGAALAANGSASATFEAPAGDLPTTRHISIDGLDAAVLVPADD